MRLLAILLAVAFLAGCTSPEEDTLSRISGTDAHGDPQTEGPAVEEADVPRREAELGRTEGALTPPAVIPFEVTVPEGGAKNVTWSLAVEGGVYSGQTYVRGSGCDNGSGTISIGIGTSMDVRGTCSDLPPGTHTFEVVLEVPVAGFDARIQGEVPADI